MDAKQFADSFILANKDFLPAEKLHLVRDKLNNLPEDRQSTVSAITFKNPTTTLLLSLFIGALGVDRFYIGDVGLGILKLILTFLVVGVIWAIVDIFLCYKKTKEANFNALMLAI